MNGCVSKTMLDNLFNKDFKCHVVALTTLTKVRRLFQIPRSFRVSLHTVQFVGIERLKILKLAFLTLCSQAVNPPFFGKII